MAFPVDDMAGRWTGAATSIFYRAGKHIPEYYRVTTMTVVVKMNGQVTGKIGDGCEFEGLLMRTSSTSFPLRGFMSNCQISRMNGNFDGVFNKTGDIRIAVRDKMLGRVNFAGKLSLSTN